MDDWRTWAVIAAGLFLALVVAWFIVVEVAARRRPGEPESTKEKDLDIDPLP